jgi:Bifunctional DNA primase/polymerase, N-terminal
MTEMVVAAQRYAAQGWPVFPVRPDKTPRTKHGHKDASRNEELIAEWWRRWPDAGIGLAIPEGLLVFDIDPRNGGERPRELPRTKESVTRSGGAHLYFSVPPGLHFVGHYAPGIDLKAPGKGYVILPPTPGYRWMRNGALAELPSDVLDRCTRSERVFAHEGEPAGNVRYVPWEKATRYGQVALENQAEKVRTAAYGERNNTLFASTCAISRLIAGGELDEDYALKALFEAAVGAGLDEVEVVHTMESGYQAGIQEPRGAPA